MLRNQIQPHFIYNSLSIIRSLAKRDSQRTVECIDDFSDYLKAHIGAIKKDDMIPFEAELNNVRVYLSLVLAERDNNVDIVYDLGVTDFRIPPLSLEPIVENAVNHGISRDGGQITIRTEKEDDSIVISISDSGSAKSDKDKSKPIHMGIGIDNTRKRLSMLCNAEMTTDFTENGSSVRITIPDERSAEI